MLLLPPLAPAGRVIVLLAPCLPLSPSTLGISHCSSSHDHPVPPAVRAVWTSVGHPYPTALYASLGICPLLI